MLTHLGISSTRLKLCPIKGVGHHVMSEFKHCLTLSMSLSSSYLAISKHPLNHEMEGLYFREKRRHTDLLDELECLYGRNHAKIDSILLDKYPLGLYCEQFVFNRKFKTAEALIVRVRPDILVSFTNEEVLSALQKLGPVTRVPGDFFENLVYDKIAEAMQLYPRQKLGWNVETRCYTPLWQARQANNKL